MAGQRNKITIEILEAARRKGWSISQTARHYSTHHTTIGDACKRLNVELPRNQHIAAKPCEKKERLISEASNMRVKAWSCKPAAIERALAANRRQIKEAKNAKAA